MQGFYANLFGTCLFAMVAGGGNPIFYAIFFVLHVPMAVLSDKNPLFFHEWALWLRTRGAMIGEVLHAQARRAASSV